MSPVEILGWSLPAGALLFAAAELLARRAIRAANRYFVCPAPARRGTILDRRSLPGLPVVVRTEINADGERGDALPEDWSRSWRVLVLGGSSTECHYVDQPSTWPAVAQRFLNRAANLELLGVRRAHVGNVGRSLATCRHLNRMLERILPRTERLDAVVIMAGAADLVDWLARGAPKEIADDGRTSDVFADHPEGPFGWTPRTLALRRLAGRFVRRFLRPAQVRANGGKALEAARERRARAKEFLDEMPDPEPLLRLVEDGLRELIARSLARARTVV